MIAVQHLVAGAVGTSRLVRDDLDRQGLLRRVASVFGEKLLAYCLMDTHVHVTVEGHEEAMREALRMALRGYARTFNARHGRASSPLLRAPVDAFEKRSTLELARTIRYAHENPTSTKNPIVDDVVAFEWSSARAYAGFTRAPLANVARARALLGDDAGRVRVRAPALADLAPLDLPRVSLENIIMAVAQVYGLLPDELASGRRRSARNVPRGTVVALGRLEAYRDAQLARALGRTVQRIWQLADHADEKGIAIARTILVTPALRARLGVFALPAGSGDEPESGAQGRVALKSLKQRAPSAVRGLVT